MNGTKTDLNRWLGTFIATDIQNMNRNAFMLDFLAHRVIEWVKFK